MGGAGGPRQPVCYKLLQDHKLMPILLAPKHGSLHPAPQHVMANTPTALPQQSEWDI
jgi:hypothetical protein